MDRSIISPRYIKSLRSAWSTEYEIVCPRKKILSRSIALLFEQTIGSLARGMETI